MADIIVNCPQCQSPLRVREELIGRAVQCPACGMAFAGLADQLESAHASRLSLEERLDTSGIEEDEIGRARSLIIRPAILLLVTGVLGFFADMGQAVYAAIRMNFPGPPAAQPPRNFLEGLQQEVEQGTAGPLPILFGAAFAVASIVIIIAAVQMLRLRGHGLAVAGSMLAMVNFVNCCCLLGLPAGIWCLSVLSKPEVKAAFQRDALPQ